MPVAAVNAKPPALRASFSQSTRFRTFFAASATFFRQMGGTIGVDSVPGYGSEFRFTIEVGTE